MEDESDYLEDEDPPRVRPVRMIIASIIGVPSLVITVWLIVALAADREPDPYADVSVVLQPLANAVGALLVLFFGIVSLACFFTLVSALLEARRARKSV